MEENALFGEQNERKDSQTLNVGDWVTQYGAGYWQVVKFFPKYADEDYSADGVSWKRGDRLGSWVILKKGFTAKMKPGNACDLVDARWCKPVPEEIRQEIAAAFAANPRAKRKFDEAPDMPNPAISTVWLKCPDDTAAAFSKCMEQLSARFTVEQFWDCCAAYRSCIADPSEATHILRLHSHLWEIDDRFRPFLFEPEIMKLTPGEN